MKLVTITLLCSALMLALAHAADPDPLDALASPVLKLKGREPEMVDTAAFRPAAREYKVTKGPVIHTYKMEEVEYCIPPKPKGFDKLNDIAALEAIAKTYSHLWWDNEAARKLMPLYLEKNDSAKAIRLYKDVAEATASIPIDLRRGYWKAMLLAKQYSSLEKDTMDAATSDDREASAWAYISRGDMFVDQEQSDKALVDGYLKTIAMFGDIPAAKLTALEKTVALMEKNADRRVERFQKMLKTEFPGVSR